MRPAVAASRIALARAHLDIVAGDLEGAKPHIARALRGRPTPRERFWLHLAHGDALAHAGHQAVAAYTDALHDAARLPEADAHRRSVLKRLAEHYRERDRLTEAVATLDGLDPGDSDREVALIRATIALLCGEAHVAVRRTRELLAGDDLWAARARLLAARALLQLGDVDGALAVVRGGAPPHIDAMSREAQRLLAQRMELEGEVLGRGLAIADASRRLQEAASLSASIPDPQGVCRANTIAARIELRAAGDLHAARTSLDHARRANPPKTSDEHIDMVLTAAELQHAEAHADLAVTEIDRAWAYAERGARPPSVLTRVALAGLALGLEGTAEKYLEALLAALDGISPPRARLAMLEPLRRCPSLQGSASRGVRMFVRASVPSPSSDPDAFAGMDVKDLAHLKLLDAELLRVIGDPLDAVMRSADVAGDIASTIGLGGLSLVPFGRFAYNMALRPVARRLAENAAARARGKQNVFAAATMVDAVLTVAEHDALDAEQLADLSKALPLLDGSRDGRIWAARAWERLAVDLVARGEDPGVPASRAAAIYDELGDAVACTRAVGLAGAGVTARVSPSGVHEARVYLNWDTMAVDLVERSGARRVVASPRIGEALGALISGGSSEAATWGQVARLMLSLPDALLQLPDAPVLALSAEPRLLHALPWELQTKSGARIYRPCGPPGPRSALPAARRALAELGFATGEDRDPAAIGDAVRAFQRSRGLPASGEPDAETAREMLAALTGGPRPLVLVLRPVHRPTRRSRRGFDAGTAIAEWACTSEPATT